MMRTPQNEPKTMPSWMLVPVPRPTESTGVRVNDIHSRLNETWVRRVVRPQSLEVLQAVIRQAAAEGKAVSLAGGRHAMGGQQFGNDTILLDTAALNRVLAFDRQAGLVTVQGGIRWPDLLEFLQRTQLNTWPQWGIRQKQTGADRLSLGGALSANAHGRGLRFKPLIDDVESFTLVDAGGSQRTCSRTNHPELFRLVIGGYGLFGVIADVTLRLVPRQKVQRVVTTLKVEDLVPAVERRTTEGFLYGDFQFNIDTDSDGFLRDGVFSCYQPIEDWAAIPTGQKELRKEDWLRLFYLAHTNKSQAFEEYATYYLSTHGQRYWSDSHQLSEYFDDYHRRLDPYLGPAGTGTEMITEVYVPRHALSAFMEDARRELRARRANVIYGTIRFIEQDDESFLAWAKDRHACIIFNLHTAHTREAIAKTAGDFRQLIEHAVHYSGSYYLTYHRWATRLQLETCYPQFLEFLKRKLKYDPQELFQSEWYRHYRAMFADSLVMLGERDS